MPTTGAEDASRAPVFYRLAPTAVARLLGLALVLLAVVIFAGTAAVALSGAPPDLLVGLVLVTLVGLGVVAWWLRARAWVLRCTAGGYRVGLVRGAGTKEARWKDVEDAVTVVRHDVACVVLRLRDGRTTTIPVGVLAIDKEQFVRELRDHLQHGQGLRRL